MSTTAIIAPEHIEQRILFVRETRVMLDQDLAALYGVTTKALVQAVKRNADRFPGDFMFRLSREEFDILRSQSVTSSWGGRRYPPYAFTEQGVAMLSAVLQSSRAVAVSIEIVRVFVRLRKLLDSHQFANRDGPRQGSEEGLSSYVEELAKRGVHVPVALHAWLIEVGNVDFTGTHPDWPRTGYAGLCDKNSQKQYWCTDPLFVWFDGRSLLESLEQGRWDGRAGWIDIAPDEVHKANVSGGAPVSINCESPLFDASLVGQSGSFTLLSYLRSAFEWSGFPGFQYIPNAPREMLHSLGRGLTRL